MRGLYAGNTDNVLHAKYSESHFSKYTSFKHRINYIINLINSFSNYNFKTKLILSIGPRFESELYGYRGLGFKSKNIFAIDTFTYSPKILPGNMHNIDFGDNFFDIVVCGWTIAYSNNPEIALREMHRILKPNGKIILTWDLPNSYKITDSINCLLTLRNNIDDLQTVFSEIDMANLANKLFKIYRVELGKLNFNGNTPFATLILEKS